MRCWLQCKYCRGRYLKGMHHILKPNDMYEFARVLSEKGRVGFLISGGFTREGKLPISPFLDVIRNIKERFNLTISIHSGLIDDVEEALSLRVSGIDIVDFDFTLNDHIIKLYKNLRDRSSEDYKRSLRLLLDFGPERVVPHIIIGFPNVGRDEVLYEVGFLKDLGLDELVILILVQPLKDVDVETYGWYLVNLIADIREKWDGVLSLGCMRPQWFKRSFDEAIIRRGLVDRIVNPSLRLIRKYRLRIVEACCSIP